MFNNGVHRGKTVCRKPQLLQQEKDHLTKALTKCKYPKSALDKVEKRLNRSTSEASDGVNNQGTSAAQPVTNEVKIRVKLSYPTQKVFVKVSKRSVVGMTFKPTLKVAGPSKAFWFPSKTQPYGQPKWCHLLVPMW